jgi:hypothetical protein
MSRKRGLRGFERIAQFTNAELALAQRGNYAQPSGIGESFRECNCGLYISEYTDMFAASQISLKLNA